MTMDTSAEQLAMLKMSGDYNNFKELLRSRLHECGWVDQIHMMARETKKSSLHIGFDGLYTEVSRKGRTLVPAAVKRELLLKVKDKLLSSAGYYDD